MTQKIKVFAICSIIMASILLYGCGKKSEKVIKISGSSTMGPMMRSFAELHEKSHTVTIKIDSSGSLKGIACLLDGKCDLAAASVKMPAPQMWEAQKKGIVLKEFIIAYDIIIPIVHPSNPIKNLFLGQLSDMYTGLIKDWKDAEGKSGKIIVVDRDAYSGTKLLMSERFFESKKVVDGSIQMQSDRGVVSYIAKHPTAVGYISKSFFNKSVKTITINGFSATLENVEKGYYPLYRELYVYVNDKFYTGEIKSFIDTNMTKSGQDLVEKSGFIPVTRMNKPAK